MAANLSRRDLFAGLALGTAAVGLAALSRRRKAASSGSSVPTPALVPGGGWKDEDAPRRIRELAYPIGLATGFEGLGDFLVAVAWTESRGDPRACRGSCGANSERGWFQLRPNSARVFDLGLGRDALFDEPTQVALAAWYADRLRPFAAPGQSIDHLALRRGWVYPSRVSDVAEAYPRSVVTRKHFAEGIAAAGLPSSFMYTPAFSPTYAWPGIDGILELVGRGPGVS